MITRTLPVELTKDEVRMRGEALARKHAEWDSVESARKAAQTHAKSEEEKLNYVAYSAGRCSWHSRASSLALTEGMGSRGGSMLVQGAAASSWWTL